MVWQRSCRRKQLDFTLLYIQNCHGKILPHINKKISCIFYGTAMMPFLAGEDGSELLDSMYALGINALVLPVDMLARGVC